MSSLPAPSAEPLTLYLAAPRGFCAGVDRAIAIVEEALRLYGPPIYVRNEIVHNRSVVEGLRGKGVVFVKAIQEVPEGGILIFSAHGISEALETEAKSRDLPVVDATCPLVTKVHNQAKRHEREGRRIILIGHQGHPEVEGTSGRVKQVDLVERAEDVLPLRARIAPETPVAYVTQTTLSVDDTRSIIDTLKAQFPEIHGADTDDICYATQNRQEAVRALAQKVELILVVGSKNSSNSNRLRDLGLECGVPSYLIDDATDIAPQWLDGITRIGITAGASAPESLVERVVAYLSMLRPTRIESLAVVEETLAFNLPAEVRHRPFADKLLPEHQDLLRDSMA